MIRSMTAFARCDSSGDWGGLTIELRSVNHRYLEVTTRMPEELRHLEGAVREAITARLGRGKVECAVRYHRAEGDGGELHVNEALVKALAHASREVDAILYNAAPVSSLEVLRWPGVLEQPGVDPERLKGELLALLGQATDELLLTREREGEKLAAIIEQRCAGVLEVVSAVRRRMPEVLIGVRERLQTRVAELQVELDPQRLEQEVALLAQKLDVDEEIDRLETHIGEVRRVLQQDQPVGRRLDFLMQELNREANTLGSKSADTETTRASVDLKVLIEQMREQVQNIE